MSAYINELVDTLPKLSLVDVRIVLQDQYEFFHGIHNHRATKDRPLASVAMFECENFTERSRLWDAYEEFGENGFRDIWGLSVTEFLNQPQYIVRMMREMTREILSRKTTNVADALKEGLNGKK